MCIPVCKFHFYDLWSMTFKDKLTVIAQRCCSTFWKLHMLLLLLDYIVIQESVNLPVLIHSLSRMQQPDCSVAQENTSHPSWQLCRGSLVTTASVCCIHTAPLCVVDMLQSYSPARSLRSDSQAFLVFPRSYLGQKGECALMCLLKGYGPVNQMNSKPLMWFLDGLFLLVLLLLLPFFVTVILLGCFRLDLNVFNVFLLFYLLFDLLSFIRWL